MKSYKPSKKIDGILSAALKHIKSVPYKVSLRWVFYRLLQDSYYSTKDDYSNFKSITSKARKRWYDGWAPDTLSDDTRNISWKGWGYEDEVEWINNLKCSLDKYETQNYFLLLCFEARAMFDQFSYYTKNIPLAAFGGDASIPYKWEIAKEIEEAYEKYQKPIVILYFGDCDSKGEQIKDSAFKDIKEWCNAPFELIYCGLTKKQAKSLNLTENLEKKGEYQWEALTDKQAKKIIFENVKKYQNLKLYKPIEELEEKILMEKKILLLEHVEEEE